MPRRRSRARKAPAGSTQGAGAPILPRWAAEHEGSTRPCVHRFRAAAGSGPVKRQPGFPAPRTRHDTAVSCRDGHGAGPQRDSEEVPPRATSAARVGRPRQPESGGLLRRCGTDNCGIREKLPTSAIYGRASSHSCNTGIRAISAGRVRHRGGNAVPRVWLRSARRSPSEAQWSGSALLESADCQCPHKNADYGRDRIHREINPARMPSGDIKLQTLNHCDFPAITTACSRPTRPERY
jgi:hypothetical protein